MTTTRPLIKFKSTTTSNKESAMSTITDFNSVDDFPIDASPNEVARWAVAQHALGVALYETKGKMTAKIARSCSQPFDDGFTFAQAAADEQHLPELTSGAVGRKARMAQQLRRATAGHPVKPTEYEADSLPDADSLIAEGARTSMRPLIAHYASEELLSALATVEAYGRVVDGGLSPNVVHTLESDADEVRHTPTGVMPLSWGMRKIRKALTDKVAAEHVIHRIPLAFAAADVDANGWALPGTPELVFMAMSEGSRATLDRGEVVWVLYYLPAVNTWVDKRTGEIKHGSSAYTSDGWVGVVRTFGSFDDADDAAAELKAAVRSVRSADAERARADEGSTPDEDDPGEAAPLARKARVQLL